MTRYLLFFLLDDVCLVSFILGYLKVRECKRKTVVLETERQASQWRFLGVTWGLRLISLPPRLSFHLPFTGPSASVIPLRSVHLNVRTLVRWGQVCLSPFSRPHVDLLNTPETQTPPRSPQMGWDQSHRVVCGGRLTGATTRETLRKDDRTFTTTVSRISSLTSLVWNKRGTSGVRKRNRQGKRVFR